MRPLETLLLLACAAWLIQFASLTRPDSVLWSVGLQVIIGVVLGLQVLVEGWRWQIFPLYLLAFVAAAGAAPAIFTTTTARLCFSLAGFAGAAASVCAALIFQHLTVPGPSGPGLVGVTILRSSKRPEPSRPGPDGELLSAPRVRLWYPAAPRALTRQLREFLQARLGVRLKQADSVPAATDAQIETGNSRLPVVVYIGGWPEDSVQNRSAICELVSRGFVVASLEYPDQPFRPLLEYSSDAAFRRTVEQDNARARAFARDASLTLDELAALDQGVSDRRFAHRLSLGQAGILGYSFGGAVAAQATRMDSRFTVAVNLDGRHWAEALQSGVSVPYMFIGEELLMPTPAMLSSSDPATRYEAYMDHIDYTKLAANLRANGGIQVTIDGTAHVNFSDDVLRSPLRRFSGGGTIDPRRGLSMINSLVVMFFGQHLARRPAPLLTGNPRPFPQARAEYWPTPTLRTALPSRQ